MEVIKSAYVSSTLRAGLDVLELHYAHGYLMHQFLSPISNHRTDEYGGCLANRLQFPLEVIRSVREVWPAGKPLTGERSYPWISTPL